jgi:site-specific recombinase XerD
MNDLIVVPQQTQWHKLKALVLDSVSSPITKQVYNLGLDEFFAWFGQEPRNGFTKATVSAWRVSLEARGLGAVSINVRITAVRKLAVEAADNGLLAPGLANGITRVKGVASKGVRLGNWLTVKQAQTLLNTPDASPTKGLRDRAILAMLREMGLTAAKPPEPQNCQERLIDAGCADWCEDFVRAESCARQRAAYAFTNCTRSGSG